MKTLTLKIRDDCFDKVVSFLEILPKRAVQIKQDDKKKKNLMLLKLLWWAHLKI